MSSLKENKTVTVVLCEVGFVCINPFLNSSSPCNVAHI